MGQHLSFYKLFVEKGLSIEIPIIQRDYAQGRSSEQEIRDNFLDTLYNYLEEGVANRDLDFIYGEVNKQNKFIPLDGQQRLTTLFLLHYYLALKDNRIKELQDVLLKGGNSNFTYKTRESSTDFCNALLKNSIQLQKEVKLVESEFKSISEVIKNCEWYFLSWAQDPTVQAMLTMFDAIQHKFAESKGFYEKLISINEPVITFQFLELKEYGLTEDLYIKMNSRGKPLTKFENFKAKFEQHLDKNTSKTKFYLIQNKIKKAVSTREYFSYKIDTDWTDLFWIFRDTNENIYDDQIMHFISSIAINYYAIGEKNTGVRNRIDNQSVLPFDFYFDQGEDFVGTLISAFDVLCTKPMFQFLPKNFHYYNEIESFANIVDNNFADAGYHERIQFFAYYSFLIKWKGNQNGFDEWMRVVANLSTNTAPYNSDIDFVNALRAVNNLLHKSDDILKYLRSIPKITGFYPYQVKEEIIKANLLTKHEKWKAVVLNAEKHNYFKGQLTFALAFSGIENFFDLNGNCTWSNEEDLQYLNNFIKYTSQVFALYDEDGLVKDAKNESRFIRATLTKGNYLLEAKSNLSFLRDSERDVSWKRLLLGDDYRDEKREFVKQVLDDHRFNSDSIQTLDELSNDFNQEIPVWRIKFINQQELFDYLGPNKFIRYVDDDTIYLLGGEKISGEHVELFSYALFLKLKAELNILPFNFIEYTPLTRNSFDAYFSILDWKDSQKIYNMDISYDKNTNFHLKFYEIEGKSISQRIKDVLNDKKFIEKGKNFERIISEGRVKKLLENLFKDFIELK